MFRFQVFPRRPVSRGEPGGPAIWPLSPSSCSVPSLFVPTSAIAERDGSPHLQPSTPSGAASCLPSRWMLTARPTFGSRWARPGAEMGTYELDYPYCRDNARPSQQVITCGKSRPGHQRLRWSHASSSG